MSPKSFIPLFKFGFQPLTKGVSLLGQTFLRGQHRWHLPMIYFLGILRLATYWAEGGRVRSG